MDKEYKDFQCHIDVDDEFYEVSRLYEGIERIAHYYGLDKQLDITVEESSELIKSIMKFKRDNYSIDRVDNVIEEMADVYIMLHQLIKLFCVDEEIIKIANEKVARQLDRIKEEIKCSRI